MTDSKVTYQVIMAHSVLQEGGSALSEQGVELLDSTLKACEEAVDMTTLRRIISSPSPRAVATARAAGHRFSVEEMRRCTSLLAPGSNRPTAGRADLQDWSGALKALQGQHGDFIPISAWAGYEPARLYVLTAAERYHAILQMLAASCYDRSGVLELIVGHRCGMEFAALGVNPELFSFDRLCDGAVLTWQHGGDEPILVQATPLARLSS